MEGRYFVTDLTGHMKMPGPDGKPKDVIVSTVGLLPTTGGGPASVGRVPAELSVIAT
jgi:hypothetical protein